MKNLSYLSPKTQKRGSPTHGTGLFAVAAIHRGETVAVKGGYIMTRSEWAAIENEVGCAAEIQLSDELVIAPRDPSEFDGCMMALNHSCDPNVGVKGQITFVAMQHIEAAEELTIDYAMIDDFQGAMDCSCGKPNCRKSICGKDWQRPELQKKYHGYFANFIQEKIRKDH